MNDKKLQPEKASEKSTRRKNRLWLIAVVGGLFLIIFSVLPFQKQLITQALGQRSIELPQEVLDTNSNIFIEHYKIPGTIPTLTDPEYKEISVEGGIKSEQSGIVVTGQDGFYFFPHNLLQVFQIVTTTIEGKEIIVTYSPITNTSAVYEWSTSAQPVVSDIYFAGNAGIQDQNATTLWKQFTGEVTFSTDQEAQPLTRFPSYVSTAGLLQLQTSSGAQSKAIYILSEENLPKFLSYSNNLYSRFTNTPHTIISENKLDDRLTKFQQVQVVQAKNGETKAYPLSALTPDPLVDEVGGQVFTITGIRDQRTQKIVGARVDLDDQEMTTSDGYWVYVSTVFQDQAGQIQIFN